MDGPPAYCQSGEGRSWNCRSLWAHEETDTIHYVKHLLTAPDFIILQETRETTERLAFLKQYLTDGVSIFSSGISQFSGGVAVIVKNEFFNKFTSRTWHALEVGRLGQLQLCGPRGELHLYAVYLDPACSESQSNTIRLLSSCIRTEVHNLICGDFNFTMHDGDRIQRSDARTRGDDAKDGTKAKLWRDAMRCKHLQEFEQHEHTLPVDEPKADVLEVLNIALT